MACISLIANVIVSCVENQPANLVELVHIFWIQQTVVFPLIYFKLRNDIAKVPIEPGAGASGSAVDFDIVMTQFSYHQ